MAAALLFAAGGSAQAPSRADRQPAASATFRQYCVTCHNAKLKTAGIVIDPAEVGQAGENAELWEKVVQKLRTRGMPPAGMPRPDDATYDRTATYLETTLDQAAAAHPHPGDLPYLHRLTRTEYQNAVRDLLGVDHLPKEMDYSLLLPADNSSQRVRQHRRPALHLASDHAALSGSGPQDQPPGGGRSEHPRDGQHSSASRSTAAGRPRGGFAVRHARRLGRGQLFPAGCRLCFQGGDGRLRARSRNRWRSPWMASGKELAAGRWRARGRAAGTNHWSFACR